MTLDNRFPNEEPARFKLLAAELVASRPDILVTVTRQAAIAAKQETTSIPIFFLSVPDPVESGLVASLAHPGGTKAAINKSGQSVDALRLIDLYVRRFRSRVKTGVITGEDMESHIRNLNKVLNTVRHLYLIIQRSKKRQS
jgi:hypothetical protein